MTTETTYHALIVNTIGDRNNLLAINVPVIWDLYESSADLQRRYLYTMRDAIRMMQGQVRNHVQFSASGDLSVQLGQRFDHLQKMLESVQDDIEKIESGVGAVFTPVIGELTTVQPSTPPTPLERRILHGDPYFGLRDE